MTANQPSTPMSSAQIQAIRDTTTDFELLGLLAEIERLTAALAVAHARCTNLSNAEAARIFQEAREQRARAEAAETERDALGDELLRRDTDESAYQLGHDRASEAARGAIERARSERDAATSRADRLAAENTALRAALIESVKYDDGTFIQQYQRCRICLWSERDEDVTAHQPFCPLASPPERRGADLMKVLTASEHARTALATFVAKDLVQINPFSDDAWWWHDKIAEEVGKILAEWPVLAPADGTGEG